MKPKISVVMGVRDDAGQLPETLDSVLGQSRADFEFIIVDDGSTSPDTERLLHAYQASDARVRLIRKTNQGLTAALIDSCKSAQGEYIARIDAGDVMDRDRLRLQAQVLESHPRCVLVSCHTEFHGPEWEPLWINKGCCESPGPVDVLPDNPEEGLKADIPHHGSVMYRLGAYEQAGGYRHVFYYGQDWDLWYRLAELGKFFMLPEVLYHARLFPHSISMRNAQRQRAIAECSKSAFVARCRGQDEQPWLERATLIRPAQAPRCDNAGKENLEPGHYFIGEALRRRGNPRCRFYFWNAIKARPFALRAYARLVQSVSLPIRQSSEM
jgi:glycosyltransferase involved in cell wall biosynthesis